MCIEALAVSLSPGCISWSLGCILELCMDVYRSLGCKFEPWLYFLEPWLYTGAVHGCV